MKLQYIDTSHAYWLDGKRVKSASKVAKIASDTFTVEQWALRQVAIGMTLDQTLAERVAVDLDNRDEIQGVADDAKKAAKAHAAAERGTQRHRVLELLLLGRQDQFITDQQRADAAVLARTLDAYGLEPIPEMVEQFVAWPEHGVVGRFDAYLRYCGCPSLVDLKGGINAVKYPHSTLTQFGLYRFAPHVSAKIERTGDKSVVTEWTTAPEGADEEYGYVLHCDSEMDVGELHRLDLRHGRAGAELALSIVDWRKKNNYGRNAVKQIAAPADSTPPEAVGQPAPDGPPPSGPSERSKQSVVDRYVSMQPAEQEVFKRLKTERDITDDDTIGLWQIMDDVQSFQDAHAEPAPPRPAPETRQTPTPPDEGGQADNNALKVLGERFNALPDDAAGWLADLVAQSRNGHSWEMRDFNRTVRRFEIYRGLIHLGGWDEFAELSALTFDEIVLEPLVWAASGSDDAVLFANVAPGIALGSLDAEQAATFSKLVDDLIAGRTRTVVTDTGRWRLEAVA